MTSKTFVLISSVVALALVALYGFQARWRAVIRTQETSSIAQTETSSTDAQKDESRVVVPLQSSDDDKNGSVTDVPSDPRLVDENDTRKRALADENTVRDSVRQEVTWEVSDSYSLLLKHLDLTQQEKNDVLALLIEIEIAATWTPYTQGRTMSEPERSDRISATIGNPKLQQFLALERNLAAYSEVQKIGSLLERNGAPLTDARRDRLLNILIEVRDQYETKPPSDLEARSIAYIEYLQAQRGEFERHVMELAPSVLSTEQVVYLDEQYQYLSYQRTDALEWLKSKRAHDPDFRLVVPAPAWGN